MAFVLELQALLDEESVSAAPCSSFITSYKTTCN